MTRETLEELWRTAPRATRFFEPAELAQLPASAQRYLTHTISPGTPLATAARVTMHGTIKIGPKWTPFEAEQVLRWDRGFVWRARTHVKGLPVSGADRFLDGEGAMRWKVLGIVPVMSASGPEITRSAAGRFHAEAIWLPGVLIGHDVVWTEPEAGHSRAIVHAHGEESSLDLTFDDQGGIRALTLPRWYSTDKTAPSHYETFGGTCGDERTFGGVTLPTTYELGWFFGSDRFEHEGAFFRCTLDSVEHRFAG